MEKIYTRGIKRSDDEKKKKSFIARVIIQENGTYNSECNSVQDGIEKKKEKSISDRCSDFSERIGWTNTPHSQS